MRKLKFLLPILSIALMLTACNSNPTMEQMDASLTQTPIQNSSSSKEEVSNNTNEEISSSISNTSNQLNIGRMELIEDYGLLCSTGIVGTVNENVINVMKENGYPDIDFSYDKWIKSSNFEKCDDEGILWMLSIINTEIGGGLLEKGDILTEEEFLNELNIESLPITDMVAIVNHEKVNYCVVARVDNETAEIEKENATNVCHTFYNYLSSLEPLVTGDENDAKLMSIGAYAAGPYVWFVCLSDNQNIEDFMEAYDYHLNEYNTLQTRFNYLFDYLRIVSLEDKKLGFDTSKNHWN